MTDDQVIADDWLYAAQCAELANISDAAWRKYTRDTPARKAIAPPAGRRCPDTGRPQWQRRVVVYWLSQRPGSNHLAGVRRHQAIANLRRDWPKLHKAVIADRLRISVATVERHLSGRCSCDLPQSA